MFLFLQSKTTQAHKSQKCTQVCKAKQKNKTQEKYFQTIDMKHTRTHKTKNKTKQNTKQVKLGQKKQK